MMILIGAITTYLMINYTIGADVHAYTQYISKTEITIYWLNTK